LLPHEYAVIGHSRAIWGRHLGTFAAALASGASALAVAAFKVAQEFGLGEAGQVILWPVTAALVFPLVHKFFDQWMWKWKRVTKLLKIPDLNGEWECHGVTTSFDPHQDWRGVITIDQTWEKIKVHLQTEQSSSHSISAALLHEPRVGYRLMYSYRNAPKMGEPELVSHVGFSELIFNEMLSSANGEYFNNHGRTTSGRMRLTRKTNNGS